MRSPRTEFFFNTWLTIQEGKPDFFCPLVKHPFERILPITTFFDYVLCRWSFFITPRQNDIYCRVSSFFYFLASDATRAHRYI